MAETFHIETMQVALLILLVLVAVVAGLARRFNISYPIVLVLTGLVASLLPHTPKLPLSPEVVFLVFLPPLLFAAAWQTSWRDFRKNLLSISMLAIGLVAFTVVVSAYAAHQFIPELDWRAGFLLGAVVSPTDAVAATTIARRLSLPRSIVDILEGESLLNDATGLLALEFGLLLVSDSATPSVGGGILRFFWLVGGGIIIGLLLGKAVAWFERWINDGPVEIIISLLLPYAAYLAGEAVHASGVIAVVACGLFFGRNSVKLFSPETRLQANSFWEVGVFLLNGLVFILMGLQLPFVLAGIRGYSLLSLIWYGVFFSAILIATRLVWVFTFAPITNRLRAHFTKTTYEPPNMRLKFIVGWTGMRGVVALAAAVSIPYTIGGSDFPARNVIVFLTFIVILVTLVLQGLSLPPLIKKLGVAVPHDVDCEESDARRMVLEAALQHLRAVELESSHAKAHAVEDLVHQYEHRLEALTACGEQPAQDERHVLASLALSTVKVERQTLIALRDDGRISDETMRTLERELDLSESRLGSVGIPDHA